jgi:uncharacterized membrane protein
MELNKIKIYKDKISPLIESFFYFMGAMIILYSGIDTLIYAIKNRKRKYYDHSEYFVWDLRIRLSSAFALALTYILGAEIIKTFRNPNMHQLIRITSILIIRQIITFFLDRDVHELRTLFKGHDPEICRAKKKSK